MARIDIKNKLIQAKIVYYGPGLCGKTTNLEYIASKVAAGQELMSLATEGDRTIFFDFLPLELGKFRGSDVQFKLYTVPGQIRYDETRRMVLKNVDGVVFVADSQEQMLDSNLESLENLYDNLRQLGIDDSTIAIILQYNKRDLPGVLPVSALDRVLNRRQYPTFLASAKTGEGVFETVKAACAEVLKVLGSNASQSAMRVAPPASSGAIKVAAPASSGAIKVVPPASPAAMKVAVPTSPGATKAAPATSQGAMKAAAPVEPAARPAAAPVEPVARPAAAPVATAAALPARDPPPATHAAVGQAAARAPSPNAETSSSPRAAEAPQPAPPANAARTANAGAAAAAAKDSPVPASGSRSIDGLHDSAAALKALVEPLATKDHVRSLLGRLEDLTATVRSSGPAANDLLDKLTQLSSAQKAGVDALTAAVGQLSKGSGGSRDLPDKISELSSLQKTGIDTLTAVVSQLPRGVAALRAENAESIRSLQAAIKALQDSQAVVTRPAEPSDAPEHLATKDDVAALAQRLDDLAAAVKVPAHAKSEGAGDITALLPSKEDVSSLHAAVTELREEVLRGEALRAEGADTLRSLQTALEAGLARPPEHPGLADHLATKEDLAKLAQRLDDLTTAVRSPGEAKNDGPGDIAHLLPTKEDVGALRDAVGELRAEVAQLAASHKGDLEAMVARIGQPAPAEALGPIATKEDLAAIGQQLAAARGETESGHRVISEILTTIKGLGSAVAAISSAERTLQKEWVERVATREDLAAFEQRIAHRLELVVVEAARGRTVQPAAVRAPSRPPAAAAPGARKASEPPAAAPEIAPSPEVVASVNGQAAKTESQQPPPPAEPTKSVPSPPQGASEAAPAPPPSEPQEESAPSAPHPETADPTGEAAVATAAPVETVSTEAEEPEAPEAAPAPSAEAPPAPAPQEAQEAQPPAPAAPAVDLSTPAHVNAARVARVMVADLFLYNKEAVESSILQGDFFERNKDALSDMRLTYESRVPAQVRAEHDHLDRAINDFIANKRTQLGAR